MNIMKFFGFDNDDDDYDDNDDYSEEKRPSKKSQPKRDNPSRPSAQGTNPHSAGRLILFKGVADDNNKRRLRDAFNDGAMILIDLHELDQREFEERGREFIMFWNGIAFARKGEMKFIEPAQYLVTPRTEMFEIWPEGGEAE